ncbi:hypothetical protein LCGC14_2288730 [marine sediment metagenome]|uniref:Uncharacterized protein n=1 Tax=marine sediment metagenome TaxID=412755 RepID=A0A0F9CSD3_9ZZZZ
MLHNKLNQTVEIAVLDAAGVPRTVKMSPRGRHGPVDSAKLGKVTENLIARGHIRQRAV